MFGKNSGSDSESGEEDFSARCSWPTTLRSIAGDDPTNAVKMNEETEADNIASDDASNLPHLSPAAPLKISSSSPFNKQRSQTEQEEDWAADVRREATINKERAAKTEARKRRVQNGRMAKAGDIIRTIMRVSSQEKVAIEQQIQKRKKDEERAAARAAVRAMIEIKQTVDLDYQRDLMKHYERKLKGVHKKHQVVIPYNTYSPNSARLQPFDRNRDLTTDYEQVYFDKALGLFRSSG